MNNKFISIYETLCPDDSVHRNDPRRSAIIEEMELVARAESDEDAARVIDWWQAWPNPHHKSALEFVRQARKLLNTDPKG